MRSRLPERSAVVGVSLAFAAAVVAAFRGTFANGAVWDDKFLTIDNPYLAPGKLAALFTHDLWTASASHEQSSFYRPLPMLDFALDRAAFGNVPAGYHAGNLALHLGVAAALAWLVVSVLDREEAPRAYGFGAGALAALAFALAPVNAEPVLWISGRFDLLAALFALLALLAHRGEGRAAAPLATLAFGAALLCKESAVAVPVLLALDDAIVLERPLRAARAKYAAMAAVLVAVVAVRSAVGVAPSDVAAGPWGLLASYAFLLSTFARLVAWPVGLDTFHPYAAPSSGATLATLAAAAALVAALVLAVRRAKESVTWRATLFGFAWFLVALAPAATTGPNLGIVGDRYAYLPAAGLAVALAAWLERAVAWIAASPRSRALGPALACLALLGAFSRRVAARTLDFRDDRALYEASLRTHPDGVHALTGLGALAAEQKRLDEADALLARALAREPGNWRALSALCYVRLHQNRLLDGEAACVQSGAVNGSNPRVWVNLATLYVRRRAWDKALAAAEHALAVRPVYAEARYLAAVSLANLGRLPEAAAELHEALAVDPKHAGANDLAKQLERFRAVRQ